MKAQQKINELEKRVSLNEKKLDWLMNELQTKAGLAYTAQTLKDRYEKKPIKTVATEIIKTANNTGWSLSYLFKRFK